MQNNPIPLKVGDRVAIAATARKVSPQEMDKLINKRSRFFDNYGISCVFLYPFYSLQ